MAIKQINHGSNDYLQMVNLRDNILRRPLGLTFSHDELIAEVNDILIVCKDEDTIVGCCVLTHVDKDTLRLRQMAVANKMQRRGVGDSIIIFAETLAKEKNYSKIILHARDTVIGFYEKFDYAIVGNQFYEVNLPHHLMEKKLN